jgi:hypothetical protein
MEDGGTRGLFGPNASNSSGIILAEVRISPRSLLALDGHPPPRYVLGRWGPLAVASNQLSEREGDRRDASGEHDEGECRDAARNQPEPSRSELPSQSE